MPVYSRKTTDSKEALMNRWIRVGLILGVLLPTVAMAEVDPPGAGEAQSPAEEPTTETTPSSAAETAAPETLETKAEEVTTPPPPPADSNPPAAAADAQESTQQSVFERGGPLMIAIGLCSLIVITVFFERLWRLSDRHVAPTDFVRKVLKLVRDGDYEQAETACLQSETSFAQVAFVTIKNKSLPHSDRKGIAEDRGSQEVTRLERRVGVVGVMATIAPLLGLLGTVTGMIQVFQKIEKVADPDIGLLAGGIWEALITTGAGLTVAIPAYVMYRYLLSRVDQASLTLEEHSNDLIEAIDGDQTVTS
jgi:biopolymer transport protein ExbB